MQVYDKTLELELAQKGVEEWGGKRTEGRRAVVYVTVQLLFNWLQASCVTKLCGGIEAVAHLDINQKHIGINCI